MAPEGSGSPSMVPQVAASPTAASPGNLLEMQILSPCARHNESEVLGWGPAICGFSRPPGDCHHVKV